jgi:2-keto-3-deoxy-L-rhamnonate aldolase RhmA
MGLARTNYEHNADHRAAIARTLAACHAHGKLACCNTYSMSDADSKIALGFDCITFKSDADLFTGAGASLLAQLRERTGGKASQPPE